MTAKDAIPPVDTNQETDTDLAGYDHSQIPGVQAEESEPAGTGDTYVNKDHDGGWSSQVAMDDYEDRSGGDGHTRMSQEILKAFYGRGLGGLRTDAPPKSKD